MSRADRRQERGTTLLEVIVAAAVLLVAVTGFVATANVAASSTRISHRSTSLIFLRSGLVDRLSVTPRNSLLLRPAGAWTVDACYDGNSQLLASNPNFSAAYACPGDALYRTWVNATPNGAASWTVGLYVERTDGGCTAESRYRALGCSAADLLLTD